MAPLGRRHPCVTLPVSQALLEPRASWRTARKTTSSSRTRPLSRGGPTLAQIELQYVFLLQCEQHVKAVRARSAGQCFPVSFSLRTPCTSIYRSELCGSSAIGAETSPEAIQKYRVAGVCGVQTSVGRVPVCAPSSTGRLHNYRLVPNNASIFSHR